MTKTITITEANKVKEGDIAYFTSTDITAEVIAVDHEDKIHPFAVLNPFGHGVVWAHADVFDHATREVKEPEWPDPNDFNLHVYLGSDGMRYIYNPVDENDKTAWTSERHFAYITREIMEAYHRDALPLIELELIPKECES